MGGPKKRKLKEISITPPDIEGLSADKALAAFVEHSTKLAREVRELREERDVLKKAVTFSAKASMNASRS